MNREHTIEEPDLSEEVATVLRQLGGIALLRLRSVRDLVRNRDASSSDMGQVSGVDDCSCVGKGGLP